MTEKTFQTAVNYGGIAIAISLVLNVYFVMVNFEVFRHTARAEIQAQQMAAQEMVLRGAAQEFATHANSDPHIADIFRRVQAMSFTNSPAANPKSP